MSKKAMWYGQAEERADACLHYVRELREARARTRRDPERFTNITFVIEQMGVALLGTKRNFGEAAEKLGKELRLDEDTRDGIERIRLARNLLSHEGAIAEGAARTAMDISISLEMALMQSIPRVIGRLAKTWMTRDVIVASPWWSVAQVRRTMLDHNFTIVPIWLRIDEGICIPGAPTADGFYAFIRDCHIVEYLRRNGSPKEHLRDVIAEKGGVRNSVFGLPRWCSSDPAG